MRHELVQVCNPKTLKFVLIDKTLGSIIQHKRSRGPYKTVPIKGTRYDVKEQK
jgi:hypothetical protein